MGKQLIKDKERFFTRPVVVCLCAIFCCLLWGSAFPCVKIGYDLFKIDQSSVPSIMLFAGIRFTLAGVFVIAFGSAAKRRFLLPKPRNIWRVLLVALFQTVLQYTFFYIGLAHNSGVKSSVLNGLGVFFTIIFACFIFRTEKFNLVKLLGCVLGFGGVILINLDGFSFEFTLLGEGFIIFSGLSSAFAAGLVKVFSKREDNVALCGYQFFIGGIVLSVIGLSFGGTIPHIDVGAAFMLIYLAFLSACAFTLQSFLLKYNPVSKVAVFKSTNPLFGALFSALLLPNESQKLLNWFTLPALALVCLGIFVINMFGERGFKRRQKQPEEDINSENSE